MMPRMFLIYDRNPGDKQDTPTTCIIAAEETTEQLVDNYKPLLVKPICTDIQSLYFMLNIMIQGN